MSRQTCSIGCCPAIRSCRAGHGPGVIGLLPPAGGAIEAVLDDGADPATLLRIGVARD